MKRLTHWLYCSLATAAFCISLSSCSKEESKPAAQAPQKAPPAAKKAEPAAKEAVPEEKAAVADEAELIAKLVRADESDGKADKVVSKCASCALRMDGDAKFSLSLSGFTLHFCSEECKEGYETDTAKKILALKIAGD